MSVEHQEPAVCPVDHGGPVVHPGTGPGPSDTAPPQQGCSPHPPLQGGPAQPRQAVFGCPMGAGATGSASRARRGYFLPGLIALAALLAMGVVFDLVGLQHPAPRTLPGPEVATYLSQALQGQRNLNLPPRVSCPPSEPVRPGATFSCTWYLPAGNRALRVVEAASPGQFRFAVVDSGH